MKKKSHESTRADLEPPPEPPDGGWGWVVCVGAHVAQALSVGILTSCGPIVVEWLHFFGTRTAVTTWVFSLTALIGAIFTPFAAGMTARFGARPVVIAGGILSAVGFLLSSFAQSIQQLFVFMGFILGIGLGLIYAPSLLIIGVYFKKYYTFANGIAFLGICTGQLVFSPLFVFLNSIFGWRSSLLIFAAISANVIACGAVFRPLKPNKSKQRKGRTYKTSDENKYTEINQTDGHVQMSNGTSNGQLPVDEVDGNLQEDFQEKQEYANKFLDALKVVAAAFALPVIKENSRFAIYLICTFCLGTAYFVPLVHLANKVVVNGMSTENAAWLISIMGGGSFIGRGAHGWFVDKGFISAQTFMLISILFALVETVVLVLTNNFHILVVVCFVFGINTGVVVPLTFVIPRLLVKPEQVPSVIGLTLLIHALGNAVGPVLGGVLFDVSGDYVISFCVAAGIYLMAAILILPVCHFLWKDHQYKSVIEANVYEINHRSDDHVHTYSKSTTV